MDDDTTRAAQPIVIRGVTFVPIESAEMTLDHRLFALSQMQGLRSPAFYGAIPDPVQRGVAVLADAYQSGHSFGLLATVLRADGKRWDAQTAAQYEASFRDATGDAATQLMAILGVVLMELFASGGDS